jgi:imidazolonepropionase-like amidohydrolase
MPRSAKPILMLFVLFFVCLLPDGFSQAPRDKLAIKAGKIIPVVGEEIQDGILLIEDGRIRDVGCDLEIPYDFWVIDASESVLFPGMVEPFTSRGLDRSNENLPVTPYLDVYDAIDPSSVYFEDALRDGITALLISQGRNTVIGGLARAVKPVGMTVDEMTLKEEAGIIVAFAPKGGHDRMIQMALFRETFRELEVYLENLAESKYEEKIKEEDKSVDVPPEEARKLGKPLIKEEDLDFKHANLLRLTQGKLRAFLYCAAPVDVVHALDTARAHGFLERAILVLDNPCYRAVDLIKESGRPVLLDPDMVFRKKDPLTGDEEEIFVPQVFHKAGVPFALRSNPYQSFDTRYLWYQAARLIRNGIPRQAALEAITTNPATFIGLGNRLGALVPGRDGTLLVLSGDPLDATTWVEKVIIDGRLVYEREKDYRLKELLTGEEVSPGKEKNDSDSQDKE